MFLTNVGVLLFRKIHNRNPPEGTKNLAEQTIKTHCKPLCLSLTQKNDQKYKQWKRFCKTEVPYKHKHIASWTEENRSFVFVQIHRDERATLYAFLVFLLRLCSLYVEIKGEIRWLWKAQFFYQNQKLLTHPCKGVYLRKKSRGDVVRFINN